MTTFVNFNPVNNSTVGLNNAKSMKWCQKFVISTLAQEHLLFAMWVVKSLRRHDCNEAESTRYISQGSSGIHWSQVLQVAESTSAKSAGCINHGPQITGSQRAWVSKELSLVEARVTGSIGHRKNESTVFSLCSCVLTVNDGVVLSAFNKTN